MKIAANFLRMGTESAFVVLAKAKKLEAEGKEIINLGIGQPDFRTPQHIVEAGKQALEAGHHGYTAANGMIELRTSVCKHVHKMYGATIDPSRVLILAADQTGNEVELLRRTTDGGSDGQRLVFGNATGCLLLAHQRLPFLSAA